MLSVIRRGLLQACRTSLVQTELKLTRHTQNCSKRQTNCGYVSLKVETPLMSAVRTMSTKPPMDFDAPSPYKTPGPRRHGYRQKLFEGGPLPRIDDPLRSFQEYKPKDAWNRKRALFGQNDYIDILGDGGVHPVHLIKGPAWLIGFRGNEMQRLTRRLRYSGTQMRKLNPSKHHKLKKRIDYLYKKYNFKRGKRNY